MVASFLSYHAFWSYHEYWYIYHICQCRARSTPDLPENQLYQIAPTEVGFLNNELGVTVSNSISKLSKNRTVPVMIVNNTNKTYKIKKGCDLAKVDKK